MTGTNNIDGRPLRPGTRVLNTEDGEPGSILAAVARDGRGEWVEYEVETREGIETWARGAFVLLDEALAAAAE